MPTTTVAGGSTGKNSPGRRQEARGQEGVHGGMCPPQVFEHQGQSSGSGSGAASGLREAPIQSVWEYRGLVVMVSVLGLFCTVSLLSLLMHVFAPNHLQHAFWDSVILVDFVSVVVLLVWRRWDKHILRGLREVEDEREKRVQTS